MDEFIHEALVERYNCKVRQLRTGSSNVIIKRKKKIGLRKKILGLFPLYDYKHWEETYRMEPRNLKISSQYFQRKKSYNIPVRMYHDYKSNTLYWCKVF